MLTNVVSKNDAIGCCSHCCNEFIEGQKYIILDTKIPKNQPVDNILEWVDIKLFLHYECFAMLTAAVMKNVGRFGFDEMNTKGIVQSFLKGLGGN